ncbi:MAG: hypothetical protein J0L79_01810 [Rickettsiales bacterium]|nr:hypothetical protein [Rickettsiales bacterium]MCA0254461.1 hypothetical protein [Pseudomonadota bacterium]
MLKKIIVLSSLAFLLSSCVTGPEGYLKKSANNKIFDSKGFKGGKRAPLYNKKYISQAKKNILTGEYEYDDSDFDNSDISYEDNARENVEMYKAMLEHDLSQNKKGKKRTDLAYPSVIHTSDKLSRNSAADNNDLREELNNIKQLLNDTKREMANTRCPAAINIENKHKENNNSKSNIDDVKKPTKEIKQKQPRRNTNTETSVIQPI